jgi:ribosome biogenesis GTPase
MEGRVIQSTGKWYKVDTGKEIVDSRLPGKFRLNKKEVTNPVAVGDKVDIRIEEDGSGSITEIFERKNYIPRKATHGRRGEQILASNIDRAWVVQSVKNPELNTGFIDRFLVTCEAYDLHGGIIINKADLASDKDRGYLNDLARDYLNLGYPTVIISVEKNMNLEKLIGELRNNTSVFIGPSGVGKTSILNKIEPDADFKVGEISSYSNKGKHTTTFARLVPLEFGGYIVDTPGVREFGLVQIEKSELSLFFPEMIEPRSYCRFNNCTHFHEPGCGVIAAYENGNITASRYNSYLNILDSLAV